MKYLSVCSGIEAATVAWHPLGWQPVAFSEIEKFPSQVLAHHYPDVPNLGDMTKFQEWPDAEIDVLVGGTPCQSFSVAGLRKGLEDPRGNLTLTFLAIAKKYNPHYIVWENVPGIISDSTGALRSFLDGLEELGYIIDVDIIDAQFCGVPQRRRRIFVCGQSVEILLQQKTDSSALTIAQCVAEILHGILIDFLSQSGSAPANCMSPSLSKDGVTRRMKLFGLVGESGNLKTLRDNLTAALRRCQPEQSSSGATHGAQGKELIAEDQSMGSQTGALFTLTEQSLSAALEESYEVMRSFTTSTATNLITPAQIYTCSKAALLIAKLTQLLSQSSPAFWNSALSSLTSVEEFTNYARSTSSDLFGDLERVQAWLDFIEQAEHTSESFLNIGIECFGEIFPLPNCLQGHPAPSREKGKNIAKCLTRGAMQRFDFETDTMIPVTDRHGVAQPMAFAQNTRDEVRYINGDGAIAGALAAESGMKQTNYVHQAMAVRRLTPVECERLQGFPDNYTDIQHKGKETPDGPRYKALGNSMAVPVMRWIGQRIQMVEDLCKK